jgi:hypothetical protein
MAKITQYQSPEPPKSGILKSTFLNRLSSIFGYRTHKNPQSDFEKKYGLEFVRVDLNNPNYRIKNAALGTFFESSKLATSVEKLFDEYLRECSLSYSDIAERQQRLNELEYMCYNDDFISRCVKLVADEATQLDVQNRLITIESPNLNFVQKCYELFGIWGITNERVHGACYDIELYGEAFWSHKITLGGIQRIIPIDAHIIKERLEFSPMKMAQFLAERDGYIKANKDRLNKLNTLVDLLQSEEAIDLSNNLSDMFDTKLLGYELDDGNIVPPWLITHFRFSSDHSEFFPYGRPPLIHCIAPFKQYYSTMALQGLARSMSFPVTLYKVKTVEGISPGKAFELVNDVRAEYDNLGVTAATAGNEVYTVNTKIWIADGLLDVDVKESKSDIDFVGDLEIYRDRVAIAAGVPKAYLDQEFGGFGNSGIALMEQYKPFARHVYEIQSTFLQGLGELIRLHFSITGEYDYNTPFILSMRFPAQEMGQEQRESRSASIELTQSILELLTGALGIEEGEPLPEDVVIDILSKYTFLDATDIQKWMRLSAFLKPANVEASEDSEDIDSGFDMGGSADLGDEGVDDSGGEVDEAGGDTNVEEIAESKKKRDTTRLLQERKKFLRKLKEERLKEISKRYKKNKDEIYYHFLESNGITGFIKPEAIKSIAGKHCEVIPKINENNNLFYSIKALNSEDDLKKGMQKLTEHTVEEKLDSYKHETLVNAVDRKLNKVMGLYKEENL